MSHARDNFGHVHASGPGVCIDGWGAGPYTLRVGKRRYYFTDSDMFGPLLESKNGSVLEPPPIAEAHPFWGAYTMWRAGGRKGKKVGRWIVCRWRFPRPGKYWRDDRGISHFLTECEWEPLGYELVYNPDVEAIRAAAEGGAPRPSDEGR
jgi:hypothetical protein